VKSRAENNGSVQLRLRAVLSIATMCLLACGHAGSAAGTGEGLPVERMRGWVIVLPADALPGEAYAAEELRTLFEQASGIVLTVTNKTNKADLGHIFVGPSAAMKASEPGFDTSGFGPEDLRVVIGPEAIVIAGGRPRGTLYGVYVFLEDALGVRFLTPDHTHVPALRAGAALAPMDRTYRPPLVFRFSNGGENRDYPFAVRCRQNSTFGTFSEKLGGETPLQLINHSFSHYVPWNTYGKDHPEYYDERKGKRPTETQNDHFGPGVQLCTANPDVRKLITEGVLRDLEKQPERGNISVSQNDNGQFCECPSCRALDDAAGSHMGAHLALVNEVADVVAEEHPKVLVGTLAYQYTRKPPAGIVSRPNVQIQLCSIETCVIHPLNDPDCPLNVGFSNDLIGWGKITDNVFIWNYVADFWNYLLPLPLLRSIGPNIRFLVDNNVKGVFMQGPAFGANLGGLRNYVISNMLWDPVRDERALIDEFLALHYEGQADAVREYIRIVHDAAEASGRHRDCFGRPDDYGITPEVAERACAVLERAMESAGDECVRARLERETIGCYAALVDPVTHPAMRKANARIHRTDDGSPFELDPEAAKAVGPRLGKFFALCREHEIGMFSEHVSIDKLEEVLREGYERAGQTFQTSQQEKIDDPEL